MNHPNIVQYKGAWLEIGAPTSRLISNKNIAVNTVGQQHTEHIYRQNNTGSFTEKTSEDSTDFQIAFEHSVSGAGSDKSHVNNTKKRKKRHSLSEGEGDMAICKLDLKTIEKIRTANRTKVNITLLYNKNISCAKGYVPL